MELKYDWNNEVILQFYSTLYLDEKSSKHFWMTEDEIRYNSWSSRSHTLPKKLHDNHVMELR
jgi:hypothetical protein